MILIVYDVCVLVVVNLVVFIDGGSGVGKLFFVVCLVCWWLVSGYV